MNFLNRQRSMFKITLLFVAVWLTPQLVTAQEDQMIRQLENITKAYHEVYGFSGTVKVVLDDNEIWQDSYGLANRSFEIPNTPATRNSINSISKTFTAALILKMAEKGQLKLDVPISTWLPTLSADWADSITIHHLLTHSSGLPREAGMVASDDLNFHQQSQLVDELDLMFSPGERYQYSNAGVILLGAIIEEVRGKEYAILMKEEIIKPLGLSDTGVYEGNAVVKKQAVPYKIGPYGIEETQRTKIIGESAGGGLYSTLNDLYQFTVALENEEILSAESQDLLFKKHIVLSEGEAEGYAWSLKQFGPDQIRMAAGSGYGTKSVIIREPKTGLFIGILSNWGNTPILDILRDIYLTVKGQTIEPSTAENLADPSNYSSHLGTYVFDPEKMSTYLQKENNRIVVREIDGKLFMDDELLANKENGELGLTYTDEVRIYFEDKRMIIEINNNRLVGELTE